MKEGKREPFNLSVDSNLKRQMKIYCAETGEDVSEVTEMLYEQFLKRHGVSISRIKEESPPDDMDEIATVTTDPAGRITTVNRAFSKMCGYSLKELIGKKPGEILQGRATERDVIRDFRKAIRAVEPFTCTMSNYHKNGSLYHVHISMRPLFQGKTLTGFEALENRLD